MRSSPTAGMGNVLSPEKRQVIALGRLGWSLRRIEEATGVRRETARTYLQAAGVPVRPPRRQGRRAEGGPGRSPVCSGCPRLVPVLVPVGGRSGGNSIERGRSRRLKQVRWRPRVSEDPRGDHFLPLERASNLQVARSNQGPNVSSGGEILTPARSCAKSTRPSGARCDCAAGREGDRAVGSWRSRHRTPPPSPRDALRSP
jgi:hypothetical protein